MVKLIIVTGDVVIKVNDCPVTTTDFYEVLEGEELVIDSARWPFS